MRAIGLIGLLIALAIAAVLMAKQVKAPVAVPNTTAEGVTVVPMHQAASQVQVEVGAAMQQQAQQMSDALAGAASAAEH
jgi:hypothetical protein